MTNAELSVFGLWIVTLSALKLLGVIAWPWWFVFLPVLVVLSVFVFVLLACAFIVWRNNGPLPTDEALNG